MITNLPAEQAVIGAGLLGNPVGVLALVDADFSDPRHRVAATVIRDMTRQGRALDVLQVAGELSARGQVAAAGGQAYLQGLCDPRATPAAAMGGFYAEEVRRCTRLRLVEQAGLWLAKAAATDGGDELAAVVARHTAVLAELPADLGAGGVLPAPETIADLLGETFTHDWLVPDLIERGERIVIVASEGSGKALALDTPIATPEGWTTMGAIEVGQQVFGADGAPRTITAVTDVMLERICFRITFSDGAQIVADADHQWLTETLPGRETAAYLTRRPDMKPDRRGGVDQRWKRKHFPAVVTTEHIAATLRARGGHALNHSVRVCEPLKYPKRDLLIQPYTLGAWLGDGTSRSSQITNHERDTQILDEIRDDGYFVRGLTTYMQYHIGNTPQRDRRAISLHVLLRRIGVLGNKHIPREYLESSVDQRLALVQGLMDTDGAVAAGGDRSGRGSGASACMFSVTSRALADGFLELVIGLGIKARMTQTRAMLNNRDCGPCFNIGFQTDLPVFRLKRKLDRLTPLRTMRSKLRYITTVEPVESVPVRCIQVDAPDHLFLAGRECIPTHNSVLATQLAVCVAGGLHPFTGEPAFDPQRVLLIDAENGRAQTQRRYRWIGDRAHRGAAGWAKRIVHHIRPEGLDLAGKDRAWLHQVCVDASPDLIVLGPAYKLMRGDPQLDSAVLGLFTALDEVRVRHHAALFIEAHSGHAKNLDGQRATRPYGSSVWLRWPEVGLGLTRGPADQGGPHPTEFTVGHWRGAREERDWPELIERGTAGTLPWVPVGTDYWTQAKRRTPA